MYYITDKVARDALIETGRINDAYTVTQVYDALMSKPTLKEPVKPLHIPKVKDLSETSIKTDFESFFNLKATTSRVTCIISNKEISKTCDNKVYCVLYALLIYGISKDEERTLAARDIYTKIFTINKAHISMLDMYEVLQNKTGPYERDALCDAILEVAYSDEEYIKCNIMFNALSYVDSSKLSDFIIEKYNIRSKRDLSRFYSETYAEVKDKKYKNNKRKREEVALEYIKEAFYAPL